MPDFSFLNEPTSDPPIVIHAGRAPRRKPAPWYSGPLGCLKMIALAAMVFMAAALYLGSGAWVPRQEFRPEPVVQRTAEYWQRFVTKADLGDRWPLTVDDGWVRAYKFPTKITFLHGGREYAVNGIARGGRSGLPLVEAIWAEGDGAPRRDIGPLIQFGLDLQKEMGVR